MRRVQREERLRQGDAALGRAPIAPRGRALRPRRLTTPAFAGSASGRSTHGNAGGGNGRHGGRPPTPRGASSRENARPHTRQGAPILDADELPAVAAGNPIVACDGPEPARLHDFDSLAAHWNAKPDWFVRVVGTSLSKIGFHTGDILAVRRNPDPRNGDIVVARIGDEVVVKRFVRPDEHTIELQSESHNPEHQTIRITKETDGFEVVGTVVGAIVGTRRETAD